MHASSLIALLCLAAATSAAPLDLASDLELFQRDLVANIDARGITAALEARTQVDLEARALDLDLLELNNRMFDELREKGEKLKGQVIATKEAIDAVRVHGSALKTQIKELSS
ncbi:hypothetical protein C8J56DRAFT_494233 [Mycena floridula]|nr:hypothetical protein C8J56DRAFT_494233 [Mycena floridula]